MYLKKYKCKLFKFQRYITCVNNGTCACSPSIKNNSQLSKLISVQLNLFPGIYKTEYPAPKIPGQTSTVNGLKYLSSMTA